jgi:type IV secretory pathway VirB4 component
MFDAPTSPSIDLASPVTCLDLSTLYGSPALGILMICAASWLQGAVRTRSAAGERSVFVIDEAWAVLRDVAVARWLQASWKLARAWGVANVAVLHRISDLSAVGTEGSEERNLANGILLDSETRILYAQPRGEIARANELLGLTSAEQEVLPRLSRGVALWKVAGRSSLVRHLVGPDEYDFVDSDHAMREP